MEWSGVETALAVETPVSPKRVRQTVSGGLSDTSDNVVEAGSQAQPRPQRVRQREQGELVHVVSCLVPFQRNMTRSRHVWINSVGLVTRGMNHAPPAVPPVTVRPSLANNAFGQLVRLEDESIIRVDRMAVEGDDS